jgi:glycosyltransferase involved in cell wall biosynthesis
MRILFLYQDIQSGAKLATEALISAYKQEYPQDQLLVYKQNTHTFSGRFAFFLNMVWSMWDFFNLLARTKNIDVIVSVLYTFIIPWKISKHKTTPTIFQVHGDQRFKGSYNNLSFIHLLYHGLVGKMVSSIQQYALQRATRVAFVSPVSKKEFMMERGIETLKTRSFILPNGVDTTKFYPAQKPHRSFNKSTSLRIAYIGRIDAKKGIHNIVEALHTLNPSAQLLIAYPTPTDQYSRDYLHSLREMVSHLPKRHRIEFIENIPNVLSVYHRSEYILLPSQQEMAPLVILEALACGVLPIATNLGGLVYILKNVSPLLLLTTGSPSDIRATLEKLSYLSKKEKTAMIERGARIAKSYSWKKSARTLHSQIMTIL